MDTTIFTKITKGNVRAKRAWAESLYASLKGILTGEGYRNSIFDESFINNSPENQKEYLNEVIDIIRSVDGYEHHAEQLSQLIQNYHPLLHTEIQPEFRARKFRGTILEWKNYGQNTQTAFLRADRDAEHVINGFDLREGFPKIQEGIPVEIVSIGVTFPDGSWSSGSELYGVRLLNGQGSQVPDGVYFDLQRDNSKVLEFMVISQKELGRARQLLYQN